MKLKNEEIGEICGIFCGDGNLDKTKPFIRIYIALDEKEYAGHVSGLLSKFVGRKVKIHRDSKNVWIVYVFSEKLQNLIKKYLKWKNNKSRTVRLAKINYSKSFLKGFLRGLLDTDGCLNQGQAEITTVSKNLKIQISYILKKIGFDFKIAEWDYGKGIAYKIFMRTLESKRFVEFLEPKNKKRLKVSDTLIDHHEENKILELREGGMKVYDIAKEIKRSHASVTKFLLKHGISKKRTSKREARKILIMWRRGYSREKIVKTIGKNRKIVNWTISKRSNLLS